DPLFRGLATTSRARILCVANGFALAPLARIRQNLYEQSSAGPINDERAPGDAGLFPVRMDAVAALLAGAAQGRIHFGHRRLLVPRDHARRCDPHHRDGGDEWLPQRAARQNSRTQRAPADPATREASY